MSDKVEPQGWGQIKPGLGYSFIKVFEKRVGLPTVVKFLDGRLLVTDDGTAWGRDAGDLWEHVYAHLVHDGADSSPADIAFFYLSEVESLWDPDTDQRLISRTPKSDDTDPCPACGVGLDQSTDPDHKAGSVCYCGHPRFYDYKHLMGTCDCQVTTG